MIRTIIKTEIIEKKLALEAAKTYYCEYCDDIFEYMYPGQMGCERCNRLIDDNDCVAIEFYEGDES